MKKPVFYIIIMLLFGSFVFTQENLVPNGSFEEYEWCPEAMDDFSVKYWYSPSFGNPNYLNACNNTDASVPVNSWGFMEANNGYAYTGIHTDGFLTPGIEYREYIQVKLNQAMNTQEIYKVGFSVCLAKISKLACNKLGILFSEHPIIIDDNGRIDATPHKVILNIISDTAKWYQYEDTIMPDKEYKYITIGIFSSNTDISYTVVNNNTFFSEPYYLIDDVFVRSIENFLIPNVFTPNNDGFNDLFSLKGIPKGYELIILNRWGNVIFETDNPSIEFWDGTYKGQLCNDGVYFYKLTNDDFGILKTGFIHLIR